MNHKRCTDCNSEYEGQVNRCPECNSRFFTLVSLQEVPYSPTRTPIIRVPYVPPKTKFEIEEEKRIQHEESIDPDVLVKFKHRFKLELEEIAYLEWRAMQPAWQLQVIKANSDPKSQAVIGGLIGSRTATTAAGVFIGTTAIRSEINDLNNDDGGGGSRDEEGGILGILNRLFE